MITYRITVPFSETQFWNIYKIGMIYSVVTDFKAKEPDFKPSCYYTNTKAREINDSKIIAIDYYYPEKLFKWFTEYWMLVEMLVML